MCVITNPSAASLEMVHNTAAAAAACFFIFASHCIKHADEAGLYESHDMSGESARGERKRAWSRGKQRACDFVKGTIDGVDDQDPLQEHAKQEACETSSFKNL